MSADNEVIHQVVYSKGGTEWQSLPASPSGRMARSTPVECSSLARPEWQFFWGVHSIQGQMDLDDTNIRGTCSGTLRQERTGTRNFMEKWTLNRNLQHLIQGVRRSPGRPDL